MSESGSNIERSQLDEQLVAYLDGELDAQQSRMIEKLLAVDPEVRDAMRELDSTWNMLDMLETSECREDFSRTTLEMVVVEAGEEKKQQSRRRPFRLIAIAAGAIAATAAGFLVVNLAAPNRDRQLLNDLPVVQNLDEYRCAGDIEFLRMLEKEGLFVEEDEDGQ